MKSTQFIAAVLGLVLMLVLLLLAWSWAWLLIWSVNQLWPAANISQALPQWISVWVLQLAIRPWYFAGKKSQ